MAMKNSGKIFENWDGEKIVISRNYLSIEQG